MMKRNIIPIVALMLLTASCKENVKSFQSADGSVQATQDAAGNWKITAADGRQMFEDYDSMRVAQVSEDGHPMTVIYYKGDTQHWVQYYSNMQLRSEGDIVAGSREGRWVFYHPNGVVMTDCTFVDGQEEGQYKVFRDNGSPYYIGLYRRGKRIGTWEIYDEDGSLIQKKDYGNS